MPGDRLAMLFPRAVPELTDEQLADAYGWPDGERAPTLRFNFVSSLDGAATVAGRSGPMGSAADHRVFELLRRTADVILVGAGTIRAEGYGGALISAASAAWRSGQQLPEHPAVAYLSRSLRLDPDAPAFTEAPVRPLVLTCSAADPGRRRALEAVADVVSAGGTEPEPRQVLAHLAAAGHRRILCEGGPRVLGSFQAAGAVDELCLSLSPLLAAGSGPRITAGAAETLQPVQLRTVIRGGDMLLLRYGRPVPEQQA